MASWRCIECGRAVSEEPPPACESCGAVFCGEACTRASWKVGKPHRATCADVAGAKRRLAEALEAAVRGVARTSGREGEGPADAVAEAAAELAAAAAVEGATSGETSVASRQAAEAAAAGVDRDALFAVLRGVSDRVYAAPAAAQLVQLARAARAYPRPDFVADSVGWALGEYARLRDFAADWGELFLLVPPGRRVGWAFAGVVEVDGPLIADARGVEGEAPRTVAGRVLAALLLDEAGLAGAELRLADVLRPADEPTLGAWADCVAAACAAGCLRFCVAGSVNHFVGRDYSRAEGTPLVPAADVVTIERCDSEDCVLRLFESVRAVRLVDGARGTLGVSSAQGFEAIARLLGPKRAESVEVALATVEGGVHFLRAVARDPGAWAALRRVRLRDGYLPYPLQRWVARERAGLPTVDAAFAASPRVRVAELTIERARGDDAHVERFARLALDAASTRVAEL